MIWVTDARMLPDYRLWVRFSDGVAGEIDLKDFIAADTCGRRSESVAISAE